MYRYYLLQGSGIFLLEKKLLLLCAYLPVPRVSVGENVNLENLASFYMVDCKSALQFCGKLGNMFSSIS